MEPSVQSKAKIALGKADKSVAWTVSAAYRFSKDMIRRVELENTAFYTVGESSFTDGLVIVTLLLAFVIVFLIGYCIGSRCGRRVANKAPKVVFCHGSHQSTGDRDERVTTGGVEQLSGNVDQQVSGDTNQSVTGGGGEQPAAKVKQQPTGDGGDLTV